MPRFLKGWFLSTEKVKMEPIRIHESLVHTPLSHPGSGRSGTLGEAVDPLTKLSIKRGEYRSDTPATGQRGDRLSAQAQRQERKAIRRKGPFQRDWVSTEKRGGGEGRKKPSFCLAFPIPGELADKRPDFPPGRLRSSTFVCEQHTPWGGDSFAVALTNTRHTPSGVLASLAILLLA